MSTARLARMAGQVAANMRALPDEAAVAAVAAHINQFWAPRMRAELRTAAPELQLDPLVRRALPLIR